MNTIQVSLPKSMYEDAKKLVKTRPFRSVNEVVEEAVKKFLKEEDPNAITENGFPVWFEDEVLKASAEPMDNDIVLESEEDIDNYFRHLKLPLKKK